MTDKEKKARKAMTYEMDTRVFVDVWLSCLADGGFLEDLLGLLKAEFDAANKSRPKAQLTVDKIRNRMSRFNSAQKKKGRLGIRIPNSRDTTRKSSLDDVYMEFEARIKKYGQ